MRAYEQCGKFGVMETIVHYLDCCASIVQAVGCRTPICCPDTWSPNDSVHAEENNPNPHYLLMQWQLRRRRGGRERKQNRILYRCQKTTKTKNLMSFARRRLFEHYGYKVLVVHIVDYNLMGVS